MVKGGLLLHVSLGTIRKVVFVLLYAVTLFYTHTTTHVDALQGERKFHQCTLFGQKRTRVMSGRCNKTLEEANRDVMRLKSRDS